METPSAKTSQSPIRTVSPTRNSPYLGDLSLVTLNVSGQIFLTTKATLVSQGWNFIFFFLYFSDKSGDNYFSALVNERIPSKLKTEDGAYFIDRDVECFSKFQCTVIFFSSLTYY